MKHKLYPGLRQLLQTQRPHLYSTLLSLACAPQWLSIHSCVQKLPIVLTRCRFCKIMEQQSGDWWSQWRVSPAESWYMSCCFLSLCQAVSQVLSSWGSYRAVRPDLRGRWIIIIIMRESLYMRNEWTETEMCWFVSSGRHVVHFSVDSFFHDV